MQETESVLDVGSRRPCVHFAGGEGRLSEFVHGRHSGETSAPANPGLRSRSGMTAPRTRTREDERAYRRIYRRWFPPVGRAQGAVSELTMLQLEHEVVHIDSHKEDWATGFFTGIPIVLRHVCLTGLDRVGTKQ